MNTSKWIHFVGIGGAGMSAIAQILLESGYKVTGSDLKTSEVTERLESYGATIFKGHSEKNINSEMESVVISSAIPADNAEVKEAIKKGIPVIKRAEMLGKIINKEKNILVAGAHGKTTTTSMISLILEKCGLDPTFIVGGEVNDIGSNAKKGTGEYIIAEADESDGSFLLLDPFIAVVTNVEDDHLETYGSIEGIQKAFKDFVSKVPSDGKIILCADDSYLNKLANEFESNVITYGIENNADYQAKDIQNKKGGISATVYYKEKPLGVIKLSVPGKHNLLNALAAIVVGDILGLQFAEMANTLTSFRGVKRRYQVVYHDSDITIIDDYAHHPTELKATLKAARESHSGRIICIFQPHRYSRTKQLYREFGESFSDADTVILTSIYGAGEEVMPGVSSEIIAKVAREKFPDKKILCLEEKSDVLDYLYKNVKKGDLILTMGAGDIWEVGVLFARKIGA